VKILLRDLLVLILFCLLFFMILANKSHPVPNCAFLAAMLILLNMPIPFAQKQSSLMFIAPYVALILTLFGLAGFYWELKSGFDTELFAGLPIWQKALILLFFLAGIVFFAYRIFKNIDSSKKKQEGT